MDLRTIFNNQINNAFPKASKTQKDVVLTMLNNSGAKMIVRTHYPSGYVHCYIASDDGKQLNVGNNTNVTIKTLNSMHKKGMLTIGKPLFESLNNVENAITKDTFKLTW